METCKRCHVAPVYEFGKRIICQDCYQELCRQHEERYPGQTIKQGQYKQRENPQEYHDGIMQLIVLASVLGAVIYWALIPHGVSVLGIIIAVILAPTFGVICVGLSMIAYNYWRLRQQPNQDDWRHEQNYVIEEDNTPLDQVKITGWLWPQLPNLTHQQYWAIDTAGKKWVLRKLIITTPLTIIISTLLTIIQQATPELTIVYFLGGQLANFLGTLLIFASCLIIAEAKAMKKHHLKKLRIGPSNHNNYRYTPVPPGHTLTKYYYRRDNIYELTKQ